MLCFCFPALGVLLFQRPADLAQCRMAESAPFISTFFSIALNTIHNTRPQDAVKPRETPRVSQLSAFSQPAVFLPSTRHFSRKDYARYPIPAPLCLSNIKSVRFSTRYVLFWDGTILRSPRPCRAVLTCAPPPRSDRPDRFSSPLFENEWLTCGKYVKNGTKSQTLPLPHLTDPMDRRRQNRNDYDGGYGRNNISVHIGNNAAKRISRYGKPHGP